MKKSYLAVAIVAVVLIAAGAGAYVLLTPQAPSEPLKIGILASLTGPAALDGADLVNGHTLAAEEINNAGGVLGRKIVFVTEDAAASTDLAVSGVKKMIFDDKVFAILGVQFSGMSLAVTPIVSDNKVITILNVGSNPAVMTQVTKQYDKFKYVFGIDQVEDHIAAAMYDFMKNVVKPKSYFLVAEDLSWTHAYASALEPLMKQGGIAVAGQAFPAYQAKDYSSEVEKIKLAKPDIIIISVAPPVGYTLLKQLKADPVTSKIPIHIEWYPGSYFDEVKQLETSTPGFFNYITVQSSWHPGAALTSKTDSFVQKYQQKYSKWPGDPAASAYDATYALTEAIKKAGALDADKVVSALEKIDVQGARGRIVFTDPNYVHNARDEAGYMPHMVVQWLDGKPIYTWVQGAPNLSKGNYAKPPT